MSAESNSRQHRAGSQQNTYGRQRKEGIAKSYDEAAASSTRVCELSTLS